MPKISFEGDPQEAIVRDLATLTKRFEYVQLRGLSGRPLNEQYVRRYLACDPEEVPDIIKAMADAIIVEPTRKRGYR